MTRPIAILSDFGHQDAYVGIMRSVILSICPEAKLVDLCNDVPAQNVLSGAFLLATAAPFLPSGAVVLGVVDPGVGTSRRAVVVQTEDLLLVGPDNGLFSLVYEHSEPVQAFELQNPAFQLEEISKTFHGRDIFAPACGHLARGADPAAFGEEVDPSDLVRLPEIGPLIKEGAVECRVVHVDHFGNVITNLSRDVLEQMGRMPDHLKIGKVEVPFGQTFGDVGEGKPVCYFNSSGYLEIGVRNGRAVGFFELRQRSMVHVLTR